MADTTRPHPRGVPDDEEPTCPAGDHPPPQVPVEVWAELVRYARRHRGLSQVALARAAGVSQQTISKIEAGEICPHDRLKVRLAATLDVPTGALFPWATPNG